MCWCHGPPPFYLAPGALLRHCSPPPPPPVGSDDPALAHDPQPLSVACRPLPGLLLRNRIFLHLLRTALKDSPQDHQPPTAANRQPPTFEVETVP